MSTPPPRHPAASALVGRDKELLELDGALLAVEAGRPAFVHLTGEAGIGKSTLLESLRMRAEERGAVTVVGRCYEDNPLIPFWPWDDVIRQCCERIPDAESKLGASAEHLAILKPLGTGESGNRALADGDRYLAFSAVQALIRTMARSHVVALFLEDLQWAPRSSVQLLRFLVRELMDTRLLLVATTRSEPGGGQSRDDLRGLSRVSHGVKIELGGLSPEQVGALLRGRGASVLDPGWVQTIWAQAGGNPFFALELARTLSDKSGSPGAERVGAEAALPASVRTLVLERADRASEGCRGLLEQASVLGPEFDLRLLAAMTAVDTGEDAKENGPSANIPMLEEAIRAGLIDSIGLGRYAFVHATIRNALYASMPLSRRVALHRAAGQAIEAAVGTDGETHLATLAWHFQQSSESGDLERAITYSEQAGDDAIDRLAFEDAGMHFQNALTTSQLRRPVRPTETCNLMIKLSTALRFEGQSETGRDIALEATHIATKLGDGTLLARAALVYAEQWDEVGILSPTPDGRRMASLLESADALLPPEDSALRVRLLSRLAILLYWVDLEASERRAQDALAMSRRIGDPAIIGHALSRARFALWRPDNADQLRSLSLEGLETAQQLGDPKLVVLGYMWRVIDELEHGRFDLAETVLARFRDVVETRPFPLGRWMYLTAESSTAWCRGRLPSAESGFGEALGIGQETGSEEPMRVFTAQQAMLALQKASPPDLIAATLPEVADGAMREAPSWRAGLAILYASIGQEDLALGEIEALVEEDFAALPYDFLYVPSLCLLAEAAARVGAALPGRRIHDALQPFHDRFVVVGFATTVLGPASIYLGRAAEAAGDLAAAREHWQHAERVAAELHTPFFGDLAREFAASVVLRQPHADPTDACRLLNQVPERFDKVGAPGRAEAARTLMHGATAACAALGRPWTPHGPTPGSFQSSGHGWNVCWKNEQRQLKASKGLRAIAYLLDRPDQPVPAAELADAVNDRKSESRTASWLGEATGPQFTLEARGVEGDLGPALDHQARQDYLTRIREIESTLDEDDGADDGAAESLREERSFLLKELSRAVGLGGRDRQIGSPNERARINLTRTIKKAIQDLERVLPELGEHLAKCIATGSACTYQPAADPRTSVSWNESPAT